MSLIACLLFWNSLWSLPQCPPEANAVFMHMIDRYKDSFSASEPDEEWYGLPWHTLGVKEFKPFARIYNNPARYAACAKAYMSDKTRSQRSKHFVVMSMEKLPFADCLEMLTLCYDLHKADLIHEETLSEAVLLSFSGSRQFVKNRKNPALVSILKKMQSDKALPPYMHESIRRFSN